LRDCLINVAFWDNGTGHFDCCNVTQRYGLTQVRRNPLSRNEQTNDGEDAPFKDGFARP
jgi:hypothetical protein